MIKRSLVVVTGIILSFLVSCAYIAPDEPTDYSNLENDENIFNEIDAVSSASPTKNIRVTGGKAYYTIAVLETYHKDSYPRHFVGYGIDTMYADTLIAADTPRVVICTLTNLEPGTKYNFIFVGDNPQNERHFAVGELTTIDPPAYHHQASTSDF
jgi:hypothetical protein